MSREIDAAIAQAREAFQRLRGVAGTGPATPTALPATAPVAHPAPPAPRPAPAPVITAADREARRAELLSKRPPQSWLAGDREDWRDHISPCGFVAPGAGRGDWWGPI
jgi:hypothetical protein